MNRQPITAETRYIADGPTVFDLHTLSDIGAGSADECNAHWQRQVTAHGSVEAALAAYDR
jgi:hypothetical protein